MQWAKRPAARAPVEAPIAAYPNFKHLGAEGQRLLPEQLKTMLKALARSNLLRGDSPYCHARAGQTG